MSKRELNISDKALYKNTPEDIILKSPFRIPPKELQELKSLKGINSADIAYYDISLTENQSIGYKDSINETFYNITGYSKTEGKLKMGKIQHI